MDSGMASISLEMRGVRPLLMHSGRLANRLDPHTQALAKITGKRQKTDADFAEIARLEFLGGLWIKDGEPCVLGTALEATAVNGAKKVKRGPDAKSGLLVLDDAPLLYPGPRDPRELWDTGKHHLTAGAVVSGRRVMRTRPMFSEWSVRFDAHYMPDVLNAEDVLEFFTLAGRRCGLGDWRPRYGLFEVTQL